MQGNLEELKKMNTLREDDAKALEKFADVLERAVINLKENDRQSDLKDGTLYTIILEKIPEKLLAQYYRWIKENQKHESLEKLKDWIAEEAEYWTTAAEIRNGIGSDTKTREKKVPWKQREDSAKSFMSTSGGVELKIQRCKLCGHSHPIWHCDVFKGRPVERRDLDSSREPETYEFQRFVFGGCYCPFCAQYVWQQHARDHKDQYPLVAEAVQKNCYMDDLMPSVKSVDKAKTMRKQITELGDKAGFHVRKWISHRPEVIEEIPEQD